MSTVNEPENKRNTVTTDNLPLTTFYSGWDTYHRLLTDAIAPLSPEQLALRASPDHWSIGMLATHIVGTRAAWFHKWMGVGGADIAELELWDERVEPSRPADELVVGFEASWRMIWDALAGWTPADLGQTFTDPYREVSEQKTGRLPSRQWIIWHVIEHDLHHGGEISQVLGMHGLKAPDL
jgi:uncharacterized damage-inducible protein DinB